MFQEISGDQCAARIQKENEEQTKEAQEKTDQTCYCHRPKFSSFSRKSCKDRKHACMVDRETVDRTKEQFRTSLKKMKLQSKEFFKNTSDAVKISLLRDKEENSNTSSKVTCEDVEENTENTEGFSFIFQNFTKEKTEENRCESTSGERETATPKATVESAEDPATSNEEKATSKATTENAERENASGISPNEFDENSGRNSGPREDSNEKPEESAGATVEEEDDEIPVENYENFSWSNGYREYNLPIFSHGVNWKGNWISDFTKGIKLNFKDWEGNHQFLAVVNTILKTKGFDINCTFSGQEKRGVGGVKTCGAPRRAHRRAHRRPFRFLKNLRSRKCVNLRKRNNPTLGKSNHNSVVEMCMGTFRSSKSFEILEAAVGVTKCKAKACDIPICNKNIEINKPKVEEGTELFLGNKISEQDYVRLANVCRTEVEVDAHQVFNGRSWNHKRPKKHPFMNFEVQAVNSKKNTVICAMCDTGAQVSMGTIDTLKTLGLKMEDLEDTDMKITGVGGGKITNVKGLRTGITSSKTGRQAMEYIYFHPMNKSNIISYEGLINLGLISRSQFSDAEESEVQAALSAVQKDLCKHRQFVNASGETDCTCPRRVVADEPTDETVKKLDKKIESYKEQMKKGASTEDIKSKMESEILEEFKATALNICETQEIKGMTGKGLIIELKPGAKPTKHMRPVPVPLNLSATAKADLDRDVRLGILEPVPQTTNTDWVCQMLAVPKKGDGAGVRRVINYKPLNKWAKRQPHTTIDPFRQITSIPKVAENEEYYYNMVDAWNGYHSIELDEKSRDLTTFITQWGCYRYLKAPQGFLGSGDAYTYEYDQIQKELEEKFPKLYTTKDGQPRYRRCIDDTLSWNGDIWDAFKQMWVMLAFCNRRGIIFNPRKIQFAKKRVEAFGFMVGQDNIEPTNEFIDSILNFKKPTTLKQSRGFFGLANQASYATDKEGREALAEFRGLLSPKRKWEWTPERVKAFEKVKIIIANKIRAGIGRIEKDKPLCLTTDWSRVGSGFLLLQKSCECPEKEDGKNTPDCCKTGWRIILAGGKYNKPEESRYAPIEGELLAVAIALHKCRYFVAGAENLTIVTDHNPLITYLEKENPGEDENRRLMNLRRKTENYDFKIVYQKGADNLADFWSRREPNEDEELIDIDLLLLEKDERIEILCSHAEGDTEIFENWVEEEEEEESEETSNFGISIRGCSATFYEDADPKDYSDESIATIHIAEARADAEHISWDRIRRATEKDANLRRLKFSIENGSYEEVADILKNTFKSPRIGKSGGFMKPEDINTTQGVVVANGRPWMPEELWEDTLTLLHLAHKGIDGMLTRAKRNCAYWPNMTLDIARKREGCQRCNEHAPSPAQDTPLPPRTPDRPMQMVVADMGELANKQNVLIVADRYSGFAWAYEVKIGGTSREVIQKMEDFYKAHERPTEITWDGAPNLTSQEIKDWAIKHNIKLEYSANYHPGGNLQAETNVKRLKRGLNDLSSQKHIDLQEGAAMEIMRSLNQTPLTGGKLAPDTILNFGFAPTEGIQGNPKASEEWYNKRDTALKKLADEMESNQNKNWQNDPRNIHGLNRDKNCKSKESVETTRHLEPIDPATEVWFKLFQKSKASRQWKRGVVLSRGEDIIGRDTGTNIYNTYQSRHYMIWDLESQFITSRDRRDLKPTGSDKDHKRPISILKMLEEARVNGRLLNYFSRDNDQDGYGDKTPKEDELNKILETIQRQLRPDKRLEKETKTPEKQPETPEIVQPETIVEPEPLAQPETDIARPEEQPRPAVEPETQESRYPSRNRSAPNYLEYEKMGGVNVSNTQNTFNLEDIPEEVILKMGIQKIVEKLTEKIFETIYKQDSEVPNGNGVIKNFSEVTRVRNGVQVGETARK